MNARERFLAIALVVVLVVVGAVALGYQLFYAPLADLNRRIAAAQKRLNEGNKSLAEEDAKIKKATTLSPRLEQWDKLSLPANDGKLSDEEFLRQTQIRYERLFSYQLSSAGMRNAVVTSNEPEPKVAAAQPGKPPPPPPPVRKLIFTATGLTTMDGLVRALEEFHRTPLLQQVRACTIKKPANTRGGGRPGELEVSLSVEVLMVAGAEKRADLLPAGVSASSLVLTPGRSYQDIVGHNVFFGNAIDKKQSEKAEDVLPYVKLTSVEQRDYKWYATFSDLGKNADDKEKKTKGFLETKVWMALSDHLDFTINDRFDNALCKGKALDIQKRTVFFHSGGMLYRIQSGESIGDALKQPLSSVNMVLGGLGTVGEPKDK